MFAATVTDGITTDLESIARRLTADQKQTARTVARDGRKAVLASARRRRGTLSFSGMGTKLGARTRVFAAAASATVYLDAVPAGAWSIAEHGRSAVVPRRRKALTIGDGFAVSARATHGDGPIWAGAADDLEDVVTRVLEDAFDAAVGV